MCVCSLSELHALLLNDILVLLEKHDEKFYLRCHTAETVSGNKEEYSPVIRLQECLLRHAAHDRGWSMCILHAFSSMHEVMMQNGG